MCDHEDGFNGFDWEDIGQLCGIWLRKWQRKSVSVSGC